MGHREPSRRKGGEQTRAVEDGLKEETGPGHEGLHRLRKSELHSKGSGRPLNVLEQGSDTMQQLARRARDCQI